MANQTTGQGGPGSGHEQSIGNDSPAPVDGIAGSHAGTQEPSGAHVDAGGGAAGPTPRPKEEHRERGPAQPSGATPVGGLAGMNGQGVAHRKGASGALGSHAQQRTAQADEEIAPMVSGHWTGSIARGGKSVGVHSSSGSVSRQQGSRG